MTEAASAAEALALFVKQNPPDVLVTDIGMPDMDGYELLAKIRSEYQGLDIPALALTAFAGPEDRQKALRAGFRAYLSKPVSSGELIATVGGLAKSA